MPRPTHHRCGRCAYVEPGDDGEGNCHANPPGPDGQWPYVSLERGWCGEFSTGEHWLAAEQRAQAQRLDAHARRDEAEDVKSDSLNKPIPARPVRSVGGRG
jgi:hypothetical protein